MKVEKIEIKDIVKDAENFIKENTKKLPASASITEVVNECARVSRAYVEHKKQERLKNN